MAKARTALARTAGLDGRTALAAELADILRQLKSLLDPYRPELHYMRGSRAQSGMPSIAPPRSTRIRPRASSTPKREPHCRRAQSLYCAGQPRHQAAMPLGLAERRNKAIAPYGP